MWAWSCLPVLLLLYTNIYEVLSQQKSSLTFVIDDTYSMIDDIRQVKKNADGITKIVFDEKASQIENMVLVTFNDPGTWLETKTDDRNRFKKAIYGIEVNGGDDCPEMAMAGIIQALDSSSPGSFIYVFTDASAKDFHRSNEVKNLCQKKQSQIVFVLTGRCRYEIDAMYDVYYDIARACSGLAFNVNKKEVDEILTTIKETIIGKKVVLTTQTVPALKYKDIPFEIDDQTEYAIVTASGSNVDLTISGPTSHEPPNQHLTWLRNVKVIKINRPQPGTYKAKVFGYTQTSVYIVGRTDFTFNHGFSTLNPKSLNDTTPQPIANTPTLLSISVTDPKHTVDIQLVHILDMEEQIINSLLLKQVSKDFYTTLIPFEAPSKRFKIAVIGQEVRTRKSIRRLAKLPVTPQEPPKIEPTTLKPEVTISEGKIISLEYGQTVKLTCKVTAYPKPEIEWFNRRKVIVTQTSAVEPPYKYISYITVADASENGTYSCHAKNSAGDTTTDINVFVKEPFVVKSAVNGITKLKYGAKDTLRCDITAPVPMHITWHYIEGSTGVSVPIRTSHRYSISADGTELTIRKMDIDMIGIYRCKAALDKNSQKTSVHQTQVEISDLALPEVTGLPSMNILKGSTFHITCRITGTPEPTITWEFKAKGDSKFGLIPGSKEAKLKISNVDVNQAGSYKCKAHNIKGDREHLTTLNVQVLPNIVPAPRNVFKSIEGYEATLKIPCTATGLPEPIISWMVNGISISESAKYSINNGTLVIREPKVSDSNKYRCEAKNEAGLAHKWFEAYIRQVPVVTGEKSITIKTGEAIEIPCKIVKGVPKPTITWRFMAKDSLGFVSLPATTDVLLLPKADRYQTGTYNCIARNEVGSNEHNTDLTVEYAPIILSDHSNILKGLEGDKALRIPCVAIGEPKPFVTWKMNNDVIATNEHYLKTEGALIIKDPKENDSNSYTCEAKNYLGFQHAIFKAKVDTSLVDFGPVEEVNIELGQTTKLDCGSTDSSQSIRWFLEGEDLEFKGNYLPLANVSVTTDGNYTCHVSDMNGSYTKTYRVIVGYAPKFLTNEKEPYVDWSGSEEDKLNCDVDAKPEPDIIWTLNDKVLSKQESTRLAVAGNWGNYTCNVKNFHGEVQRIFYVTSSKCLISRQSKNSTNMPLILTSTANWPILDATTNYLEVEHGNTVIFSCPNAKDKTNTFERLPGLNEKTVICDKEDIFTVDYKPYKVSDLQCAQEVSSIVYKRHMKCLSESSELIRVGYEVHGFLETYEVCFDISNKVPLYIRAMISKSNQGLGTIYHWYKHPEIIGGNKESVYTCEDSSSKSCYGKTQLVNTRDFSDGPAQKSTFIDHLNAVPYWRHNITGEWESIEDKVRSQITSYDNFVVWSGTHMLQKKNGGLIPRYLWKVVALDDDEAIAIVYINDPLPSKADFLCENICADRFTTPWIQGNNHTYCCEKENFLEAFNLRGTSVGEKMTTALDKILSKKY